jgi:hypothetical protein
MRLASRGLGFKDIGLLADFGVKMQFFDQKSSRKAPTVLGV